MVKLFVASIPYGTHVRDLVVCLQGMFLREGGQSEVLPPVVRCEMKSSKKGKPFAFVTLRSKAFAQVGVKRATIALRLIRLCKHCVWGPRSYCTGLNGTCSGSDQTTIGPFVH